MLITHGDNSPNAKGEANFEKSQTHIFKKVTGEGDWVNLMESTGSDMQIFTHQSQSWWHMIFQSIIIIHGIH